MNVQLPIRKMKNLMFFNMTSPFNSILYDRIFVNDLTASVFTPGHRSADKKKMDFVKCEFTNVLFYILFLFNVIYAFSGVHDAG